MPYPIVNPLGSIHYTSKISVPSLYWCSDYELPRISKSRRHLLYLLAFFRLTQSSHSEQSQGMEAALDVGFRSLADSVLPAVSWQEKAKGITKSVFEIIRRNSEYKIDRCCIVGGFAKNTSTMSNPDVDTGETKCMTLQDTRV